jgi:hypothetical protein
MNGINSANAPSLDLPARFMALSMIALITIGVTSPWTLPLLRGPFSSFSLLAFVHLNTLAFIGAMIIGASYQLVPVALQQPLASVRVGRLSFWFYLAGITLFLSGLLMTKVSFLGFGGSLLAVAFLLYLGVILATWLRAPERDVVAWHILFGLAGALVGMTFGFLLALNKENGMLGGRVLDLLAAHIVLMVGGWVAVTFVGVAYRLIGMFTLSERNFIARLGWLELGLLVSGTWISALRFALDIPSVFGQIGAVLMLAGLACFAAQILHLYRRRMRRGFDVHIPFALVSAFFAIAATALFVVGLLRHESPNSSLWIAAGWLAIPGFAGTAIQGFFYKIATFLVWLKRYAPVAGKQRVPRLEELYNRRLAVTGWACWTISIALGAVSLLADLPLLVANSLILIAGLACFLFNVVSISRHWLSGAGGTHDQPNATHRPLWRTVAAQHRL